MQSIEDLRHELREQAAAIESTYYRALDSKGRVFTFDGVEKFERVAEKLHGTTTALNNAAAEIGGRMRGDSKYR